MSDLIEDIRQAQQDAGERAVLKHLNMKDPFEQPSRGDMLAAILASVPHMLRLDKNDVVKFLAGDDTALAKYNTKATTLDGIQTSITNLRYEWSKARDAKLDDILIKTQDAYSLLVFMESMGFSTPAAWWRYEDGKDPHLNKYDGERAELMGGDMTDDEVANHCFMNHGELAAAMIAKDRIRWLSRKLHQELTGVKTAVGLLEGFAGRATERANDAIEVVKHAKSIAWPEGVHAHLALIQFIEREVIGEEVKI